MSDKAISVGDLVQVVRVDKCRCQGTLGSIFKVKAIISQWPFGRICNGCGDRRALNEPHAEDEADGTVAPLWRLKRIPPLSDLEGETRKEELTV